VSTLSPRSELAHLLDREEGQPLEGVLLPQGLTQSLLPPIRTTDVLTSLTNQPQTGPKAPSNLADRSDSVNSGATSNMALKKTLDSIGQLDHIQPISASSRFENASGHFSLIFELIERTRAELRNHVHQLTQLNPTRRSALVEHLERLSGQTTVLPSSERPVTGASGVDAKLRAWISGPLSPLQESAFEAYLEEIALITVGQAIVLKSWSNLKLRKWYPKCLSQMNWELSSALKALVPFGREGWQITSRTIYSWYIPSTEIQRDLWHSLESMPETTEWTQELLSSLLAHARRKHALLPTYRDLTGYNCEFFSGLWSALYSIGFTSEAKDRGFPLRSKKKVFTPTLREGWVVQCGPDNLDWVGLETNPFLLLMAELTLLSKRPSAPPLWTFGSGLESHSREQMSLRLGQQALPGQWMNPKLTLHSLIGETESCDLSFVFEDRMIRSNSRNLEAQRLREQVEEFQHFKRVRSPGTSLGDLQACIALAKLRPEGMLVWAREEALSEQDGRETLTYLLERGRLIAELNFSGIQTRLREDTKSLPRFLYIWVRETDIQNRHNHRPLRISVQGSASSRGEISNLLEDVFTLSMGRALSTALAPRSWQFHTQVSPSTQKEWSENWPEPTSPEQLLEIARLRSVSLPLAQISTVRAAHSTLPPLASIPSPALRSLSESTPIHAESNEFTGILLRPQVIDDQRQLKADPLSQLRASMTTLEPSQLQGAYHLFIAANETHLAPLIAWLESPSVRQWIDHFAERKGDRWILSEQIVKYIPVPRHLLRILGFSSDPRLSAQTSHSVKNQLSPDWEAACDLLLSEPRAVIEKLRNESIRLNPQSAEMAELKAQLFVRVSQAGARLKSLQKQMERVICHEGEVRWSELLQILPKSEFSLVSHHPGIQLKGSLPLQTTILRWEKVRTPSLGILFSSEEGHHLHLGCESSRQVDIIWDQLIHLKHPTWAELAPWLKLPRALERIEPVAAEFLRKWHEQKTRAQELHELLEETRGFWVPSLLK